jgi:hypothetical protein
MKTQSSHLEFVSIPPDEMGYAMALFVSAADRRLSSNLSEASPASPNRRCERMFMRLLCSDDLAAHTRKPAVIEDDLSLYAAFRKLWEQYEGNDCQASVCARVLAFHFLVERTGGGAAAWLPPHPDGQKAALLDPVVVEALARIFLLKNGLLTQNHLLNEVERISHGAIDAHLEDESLRAVYSDSAVACPPAPSVSLGDSKSHRLAERLLAYEAITVGNGNFAASSVCKKLRGSLASLAGLQDFKSLAARALTLSKRDGRAMGSARVEPDGSVQGLSDEDSGAAAVFISYLIALPARFIGEEVTLRMLQEVWPGLASA